jgi:5-methyltetrahydropteroyltriglutamate--homocysteine methyltransferase
MTIIDTIANEHYPDRVAMAMRFAELLNEEARELDAIGVDVIQFDEPAFNVYGDAVREWGVKALERAAAGLKCSTGVHICYGYGIKANIDWKNSLGAEWRQYEAIFPALAESKIDQVSLECINSRVPLELLKLLGDKQVVLGAIDVATDRIETPEEVAATLRRALAYVPLERMEASTNCGMAPLDHAVATAKLGALAAGAAIINKELA